MQCSFDKVVRKMLCKIPHLGTQYRVVEKCFFSAINRESKHTVSVSWIKLN